VGDFLQFWQHAGQDLEPEVILIVEARWSSLQNANVMSEGIDHNLEEAMATMKRHRRVTQIR